MKNNYLYGVIFCLLATLSWGVMFPVMTLALTKIDPFTFTALRYSIAGIIFLLFLLKKEGKNSLKIEGNRFLLWLFGSAGFAGFGFLVFLGQHIAGKTGALSASIMMATMPLLGLFLNWGLKKVRPPLFSFLFILLSFCGVILVMTKGNFANFVNHPQNYSANFLMIFGALCWVIYTIGASYFPKYSPLKYTCITTLYGLITIYFVNIVLILVGIISIPSIEQIVSVIPELLYMSLIAGFVGVLSWNIGNKILTPLNGVLFMNVVPITAFLVSTAFDVLPEKSQIIGTVLTASALVLNNLFQRRRMKNL